MKIVVLGAGESGIGAALLAKQNKEDVFVSEYGTIKSLFKSELESNGIDFEESKHTESKIVTADLIIKSPGIPEGIPIIQKIRNHKIELISEIEYAYRHCNSKIIAITGSNGKTTTTLLINHILKTNKLNVEACGNIGNSFSRALTESKLSDYYIVEVSSFQLDDCIDFKPDIALLLNITPDHLDRYNESIHKYAQSKYKIAANQNSEDVFIYNEDDFLTIEFLNSIELTQMLIPVKSNDIKRPLLMSNGDSIDIRKLKLKGEHNAFNAACASEVALKLGLTAEQIEIAMMSFSNVDHRLEKVARINQVLFVNDSKATNVDSVLYALDAFDEKIVWIAGGKDKGNDYSDLMSLVEEKVHTLICLGVDNQKLLDVFTPVIKNIEETQDVFEAVEIACKYAKEDEVVLLSPACASFDLFDNYEHRGELFKKAVFSLIK